MSNELTVLLVTAASIGFFHTLLGPDHYVPFVVMSKSGKWSAKKTAAITFLCGLGHVLGSVVLGLVGVAMGLAVAGLEAIEAVRGGLAAWALIAFGLVYFAWGLRRAIRNKPHTHLHPHAGGVVHSHTHVHEKGHVHAHETEGAKKLTPWVLFVIFVLGPCEPLIPLLIYPAAEGGVLSIALVAGVFAVTTIATMLTVVMLAVRGISLVPTASLERYVHAFAGLAIFLCGASIQFLGL
jgi:sulfite exporter TauE/SafE